MSEDDKIIEIDGTSYNKTLSEKWEAYFEAEDELGIVKKELIIESLRAKANNQKLFGYSVSKGGKKISNKGIEAIFKEKEWDLIEKPSTKKDYEAMKQKLESNQISVPYIETSPSIRKSRKKK